jgi:hypothetical protein
METHLRRAAGLLLLVSGALLVVALLLDWWGFPSAFDNPADLPRAAEFSAVQYMTGQELDADAFELFDFRDILWLAAGVAGFALGWIVLTVPRVPTVVTAAVGFLAVAALILIALTLISPPDFADFLGGDVNLGVDLPLSRDAGGFVAFVAACGVVIGAGLVFIGGERRGRRPYG